jgi:hypothetical protein
MLVDDLRRTICPENVILHDIGEEMSMNLTPSRV